jgi:hypothetical protein
MGERELYVKRQYEDREGDGIKILRRNIEEQVLKTQAEWNCLIKIIYLGGRGCNDAVSV